jgi:hypothetical protein
LHGARVSLARFWGDRAFGGILVQKMGLMRD